MEERELCCFVSCVWGKKLELCENWELDELIHVNVNVNVFQSSLVESSEFNEANREIFPSIESPPVAVHFDPLRWAAAAAAAAAVSTRARAQSPLSSALKWRAKSAQRPT